MKKLIFIITFVFCCLLFSSTAYCAPSVTITRAYMSSSDTITVTGVLKNPVDEQSLLVMFTPSVNGQYILERGHFADSEDTIIGFFDQITPETDENGVFKLELKTNCQIKDDEEYVIRIGGEGITYVSSAILGYELFYGDIDGDYIITANDAAMVLAYVLDKSRINLTEEQIKRAKVSGLNELSAADASCILNKTLDFSYQFPVEK